MVEVLRASYREAHSLEGFIKTIKDNGHEVYFRNGRLQGVLYHGETKHRFSKLGFSQEVLLQLNAVKEKEAEDLKELQNIRGNGDKERELDFEEVEEMERTIAYKEVNDEEVKQEESNEMEELDDNDENEMEDNYEEDDGE